MKAYGITLLLVFGTNLTDGCPGQQPGEDGIYLSDPVWRDANGNGRWEPGEALEIEVTMTNGMDEDYMMYPGGILTTSSREVTLLTDEWWFYGIFAGQSSQLEFQVEAKPNAARGTVVPFTVEVSNMGCGEPGHSCLPPNPITFEVTIE